MSINDLYILNNNTIYYHYLNEINFYNNNNLNLYNNDKNIENLNKNDLHKNNIIKNNFDKSNFNYFNILKNEIKSNINIEIKNNNQYTIELKENAKYLKIKHESNNIINKKKKNKFKIKLSRYKGVSKNKKKWQSYIWFNGKNNYLGTYNSEKIAAKIYDIMAIKKKGNKAKTNFQYNMKQINEISKTNIDYYKNIIDLIE